MTDIGDTAQSGPARRRGPSLAFLVTMLLIATAVVAVLASEKIANLVYRENAKIPLDHLDRVRAIALSEATLPEYLKECARLDRAVRDLQERYPPGSYESTFDSYAGICNAAALYAGAGSAWKLYLLGYQPSPRAADTMLETGAKRLDEAHAAWNDWR